MKRLNIEREGLGAVRSGRVDDDKPILDERAILSETLAIFDALSKRRTEEIKECSHFDLAGAVAAEARGRGAVELHCGY